jgi:ubiquinone/menaquinone biosynthesis C-methylase UbiE
MAENPENQDNDVFIDGIRAFAPHLNETCDDYPAGVYEKLVSIENNSFWFTGRNEIIQFFFEKSLGERSARVLEIGCGTGFVLEGLSKRFPRYQLMGADIHVEGLRFARNRLPHVEFCQVDATDMPFKNEFDAIGMFDSLEHIQNDEAALKQVHCALKSGGYFLLTVPQHPSLWSPEDEVNGHKRRYTRSDLHEKLDAQGFKALRLTSFVSSLFPILWLTRFLQKTRNADRSSSLSEEIKRLAPAPTLNAACKLLMKLDFMLIKTGLQIPFGGSLAVLAQRAETTR